MIFPIWDIHILYVMNLIRQDENKLYLLKSKPNEIDYIEYKGICLYNNIMLDMIYKNGVLELEFFGNGKIDFNAFSKDYSIDIKDKLRIVIKENI